MLLGAVVIAVAVYFGLTKDTPLIPRTNTENMTEQSLQPTDSSVLQTPSLSSTVAPPSEITWTKSDIITALSVKTGIPEAQVVFSIGETVDRGATKLIRGTVQRQGETGGAGFFAVADVNGVIVTYSGQGVPECSEVNPYGYPLSWADYCMDGGNTVSR